MKRYHYCALLLATCILALLATTWYIDTPVGKQHEAFFFTTAFVSAIGAMLSAAFTLATWMESTEE